jgi:hypothetical protein
MGIRLLRRTAGLLSAAALAACAGYGTGNLVPGTSRLDDVTRSMGPPAVQWREPDGSLRLAYPHGPEGMTTFMVSLAPDGTLRSVENVLDERHFAAVVPGKTDRDAIARMFGPPREKIGFDRSNEETWEYRFRNVYTYPARFIVVFDRATGLVKTSMQFSDTIGDGKQRM